MRVSPHTLLNTASGTDRHKVQAKTLRLRRRSKDSLIADIIRLEQDRNQQSEIENALRHELLKTGLTKVDFRQ